MLIFWVANEYWTLGYQFLFFETWSEPQREYKAADCNSIACSGTRTCKYNLVRYTCTKRPFVAGWARTAVQRKEPSVPFANEASLCCRPWNESPGLQEILTYESWAVHGVCMLKIWLFWDVTLCRWIGVFHLFQGRSNSVFGDLAESCNSSFESLNVWRWRQFVSSKCLTTLTQ